MKTTDTFSLAASIPTRFIANYALSTGLSTQDIELLRTELEKFLWLCGTSSKSQVPSPSIDDIWHEFILHTRDYQEFCWKNFGRFIHHVPQRGGSRQLRAVYLSTIEQLRASFGAVNENIWPHSDAYLHEVCSGDSCASGDGELT